MASTRRRRGLTLIELMVALTVGLVLALAVSLSLLSMGRQFRTVGASTTAQINAQLALSLIDEVGRMAGAGLFSNGLPLCQSFNAWNGTAVVANGAPLLAARVVDGGAATASDTVVFTSSNATGPLSGLPVLDAMATAGSPVVVGAGGAIADGDVAIVGVPGTPGVPCTLFQVTAAPTVGTACGGHANLCTTLARTAGTGVNAPAATFAIEPRYGFSNAGGVVGPAVVQRLGTAFQQAAFRVMCDTLVQYNAFSDAPTCTTAPLGFGGGANALATGIVQMQVQYGISNVAASDVVTSWVSASGAWANPGAADGARIKAVRIVLVSRASEPDSTPVTAATCTNAAGVVNTGPCSFDDGEAPVIDLSAVVVPAGLSWRHFRYRVHQAVIPLRSVIWSS